MKIVLDANIFISASFWGGKPYDVFERVAEGTDSLFVTTDVLEEIESALRKPKFSAYEDLINTAVMNIQKLSRKVAVSPQSRVSGVCRDPKDDKYLECAIAAKADYIISGDKDLLDLKEYGGVKIVTVKWYLETVNG
jgi:putative PIN family toxin of toxin-antitoxin system